jgi:hypothetical protein
VCELAALPPPVKLLFAASSTIGWGMEEKGLRKQKLCHGIVIFKMKSTKRNGSHDVAR